MSEIIRKSIPLAIIFITGIVIVSSNFFAITPLNATADTMEQWAVIITACSFLVGIVSLIRAQILGLITKRKKWYLSLEIIVMLLLFLFVGLLLGQDSPAYTWGWGQFGNIAGAFKGSVVFFFATAIYRNYRFKNFEAFLLMFAGMVVLLGNTDFITAMWPGFKAGTNWLLNILTTGVMRALLVGLAFGTVYRSVHILLSLERRFMGIEIPTGEE